MPKKGIGVGPGGGVRVPISRSSLLFVVVEVCWKYCCFCCFLRLRAVSCTATATRTIIINTIVAGAKTKTIFASSSQPGRAVTDEAAWFAPLFILCRPRGSGGVPKNSGRIAEEADPFDWPGERRCGRGFRNRPSSSAGNTWGMGAASLARRRVQPLVS